MAAPTELDPRDRQAIIDLLVAYSWAIDTGDAAGLSALFSPDGSFRGSDGSVITGLAELERLAARVHDQPFRLQHVASNYVLQVLEPDTVRARSYVHIYAGDPSGPRLLGMGSYDDTAVRTERGWRFLSRQYESWGSHPSRA